MDARRIVADSELGRRVWGWWNHRQTGVYVLSYPKCGRTWLRLMMGKALVEDLGLDVDPMEIGRLHRHSRDLPRIRVTHDDSPHRRHYDEIKRDKSAYAGKAVVFLVRDPRDTLISYYFQASRRRRHFVGTPSEFLTHEWGGLDTILSYYNSWADNRHVPRTFCLVRYEDLHRDPVTELARALAVVGRVPRREILERAVEFSRFENMRKLEEKGRIGALDRLKPKDATDLESYKTRKGKVGGFREYFTADEIDYMNRRIAERLSPYFGDYLTPR